MAGEFWHCPKCGAVSGDYWAQCNGVCPLDQSPYYDEDAARYYGFPIPYGTENKRG